MILHIIIIVLLVHSVIVHMWVQIRAILYDRMVIFVIYSYFDDKKAKTNYLLNENMFVQ